ncbi:MAG: S1 family peptidase [Bernardetiaceae bacterium]|jgi:hypothetical protein|nr:S1 family peptidase [Bernardetiaceae bacterium]
MKSAFELKGEMLALSEIQEAETEALMARNGVIGVGLGHKIKKGKNTGDACITVLVETKLDKSAVSAANLVPETLGKYKTDVVEIGYVVAQSEITLRNRVRPVLGGYSVGHFRITAGTIGCVVKDAVPALGVTNRYYILSNNHVLANSNAAMVGDAILQPGPFDGGANPADRIGTLARFVPINFSAGANNTVDCALAEVNFGDASREIFWNGYVKGTVPATVGLAIQKTGRTTGHTTGQVTAINATINVNFGESGTARFINQIVAGAMSAGGDSGSLVIDQDNRAVGLLFAGSTASTIINPIAAVLSQLNIKFV